MDISLLHVYTISSSIKSAHLLFHRLPHWDIVSWIDGYTKSGDITKDTSYIINFFTCWDKYNYSLCFNFLVWISICSYWYGFCWFIWILVFSWVLIGFGHPPLFFIYDFIVAFFFWRNNFKRRGNCHKMAYNHSVRINNEVLIGAETLDKTQSPVSLHTIDS